MKRAYNATQILTKSYNTAEFSGEWLSLIGKPELSGSWIIWGGSANGKTRFTLQLAKYLSQFARTAYNSLEEGISLSLKKAITDVDFSGTNILFLDKEELPEIRARLKKHKSPRIVIIDSLQYTGMSYFEYKQLKKEFPQKLFIFISHAEGKEPKGTVAQKVRYDANVKIRVEGFKAFADSRYSEQQNTEYVIWTEGAQQYWMSGNNQ